MSKITIPDNSILLLEGGSLRGLFTAGVLDTFMENDVYFPAVAGVSAGSLNALNYASHQPGRSASINLRYRHDSRYFGPKAALRGGSLFGLKFMLNDVKKEVPFDEETFAHGGMRVIAVATNVETGKPAYFEKGKTDFPFDEAVRASASLPLASVPVVLDGQPYLDGGYSCPIALNWALSEGFEKIVVITTRQKGFRKAMPGQRMVDLYDDFYGDKPLFLADMLTQELRYNTLMDQLDSMKTAFRGYDKEATCELLQTLIRSMETEKKEEHRVLLQKNQRLVKEKEALTTQMAELLMKVDSLESENQRMMEQQNTMQKKYEELAEKLSRISENAIERETELSAYHLREQQMKEREAALLKMESQKEAELEQIKKEFQEGLEAEKAEILAQAEEEAEGVNNRAEQLRRKLQDFRQIINVILDFDPENGVQTDSLESAGVPHD